MSDPIAVAVVECIHQMELLGLMPTPKALTERLASTDALCLLESEARDAIARAEARGWITFDRCAMAYRRRRAAPSVVQGAEA